MLCSVFLLIAFWVLEVKEIQNYWDFKFSSSLWWYFDVSDDFYFCFVETFYNCFYENNFLIF